MDDHTISMWEGEIAKWEIEHARAAEARAKRLRQAAESQKNLTPEQRESMRRAARNVIALARSRARRKKTEWAQLTSQFGEVWRSHLRLSGR